VSFESPGFYGFANPAWTSTFWSPTIISASGPPIFGGLGLTFDEPGLPNFSVDFYFWSGDTLETSFNISFIDGTEHDSYPASVTEPGPFVVPEPSTLALASVCAIALAAMRYSRIRTSSDAHKVLGR
jgi:hypothetical protein